MTPNVKDRFCSTLSRLQCPLIRLSSILYGDLQSKPDYAVTHGEMASGRLIGVGRLNRVSSELNIRRGINITLSEYNTLGGL